MQKIFYVISLALFVGISLLSFVSLYWSLVFIPLIFLFILGIRDVIQISDPIRRNYPVVGRLRSLAEEIRPQIFQYFVESDTNGKPFNRETRNLIYQRAASAPCFRSFGTHANVKAPGYEWLNHSIVPKPVLADEPRVRIGGPDCKQPYEASIFNVSALGAVLSPNAVYALTAAAKMGKRVCIIERR